MSPAINQRFLDYMKTTFFSEKETEFKTFVESLHKRVPKTIRVNTNKVSVEFFVKHMEQKGYVLGKTDSKNVFTIRKGEDFENIEGRLGFSEEHLLGWFYIQEISASESVSVLTNQEINPDAALTILDMAASPGGKTTQLAEYFPQATIVANEFAKNRIGKLISNIGRMGCENIGITQINGSSFAYRPEVFDYVLLDAPCSGEWIGYKSAQTLAYWNIKNIKVISQLQQKLLEAALLTLKTGGTMVYSTCTLNEIENEGVLYTLQKKYGDAFEVLSQKRFWPHEELWGGFFVAKIVKKHSLPDKADKKKKEDFRENFSRLNSKEFSLAEQAAHALGWESQEKYTLVKGYDGHVFALNKESKLLWLQKQFLFETVGKSIGKITQNEFIPNYFFGRDFLLSKCQSYAIKDEEELHRFLKGEELWSENLADGYVVMRYADAIIGGARVDIHSAKIKNIFPRTWIRK